MVLFFLLIAFFSSLLGTNFNKSFFGNYYREDGLLTLFHLVALFFLISQFWQDSWAKSVAVSLSLSNFLISLWSVFLGLRFHFSGPVGATFGQPNFLAGYLLVCLPFLAFLIAETKNKKEKIFWWLVLVFQLMEIFLTLSRAGIAGIFLFGAGWFLLKRKRGLGFLGVLVIFGILGLYFVFPPKESEFMPGGRERIFRKGIIAFTKRPILGWGWANFDYAFESATWPIKFNQDVYVDKAHSNLLEVLVTTGLVGFTIYLLMIIWIIREIRVIREPWRRTILMSFLLFLFHSQTNVISINEELIFWLILGIAGGEQEEYNF